MAKSIFQISPLDAEISNQSDSFGAVDLTAPDLPAIGAPPPLPAIAAPRPAASARMPGAVKPPATLIPVFEQAALRYDVPLNILMALGEQESRYNPMAVGTPTQWGRAKGVMQYLDSTASNLGINPFDPKQSIDAAAKQIRERLNKGYSMADAVKEHFAGPDRKRWRAKTRIYGDEVLARAARLKQELAPRYAGRAGDGAAALERISRVKPPMSVEESRARDNVPPGTDDRGWLETGAGLVADAGNLLASGVNMAAEDLTELVGRIPVLGKGITAAVDRADRFITGKGTQEIFEDTQKWVDGNFTPEMRAARQKQFVLENDDGYAFGPAWSDPRTYMSGLLESVPEMVLTMGPAGRLAKGAYTGAIAKGLSRAEAAKRAATVATVAGGVAEGLLGGAQSGREVRREVMEMPRETLEKSEALKDMMRDGLSFEEARAALAENASTQAFIVSGTLTGMFGGFGDRALAKIITGPAQGRIKSAALGALSEGLLEEMPQSVGQQVSQNLAVREADPTRSAGQGAVNAGVTGAVIGGMMGGGLGAVAPRAGGADEQQAVPPAPTPEAPPAPPPAPSGPLGRALARATAAAEAVPIAVPEPLPPEIAQQPMVLATDGNEYPVTLIGETPDAVWVKTETGEELQIPRAEIEAGNVQLTAQATIEPDLTVAPSEAEAPSTPPAVKDDLTAGAPGNLKETVTSSPEAVERVDPETGEILPVEQEQSPQARRALARLEAAAAPVEQEQPTAPPAPEPNEAELRKRLKYLSSQARSGNGWTRAMIAEKKAISAAIDAMNATATPAAEPEQSVTPAAAIAAAEAEAAMSPLNDRPEPTDAQKDAGNYKLGHAIVGGLDVSIENPAGTSRRPEWPPLKHSYGYVKRSEGADGDHVDVFLGPKAGDPTNPVFIVDQVNEDGSFDEHKVMVGFADKGAARRGYLANYEKGWQGLGDITPMPFEQFKDWVKDPTRTTAPAGTKVAPTAAAEPIAPAPVTPSEPSAELTPPPRASSPAALPPPSNRPTPVARREVSKKHPNPFVRAGERYRLSHDVDYLRAGEEYVIESAGKRTAYFRDPRNGGGTSLNNIIIEKAIRDGVMKRVDDEPAPALRAEGSTKEAEKRRQIDAGFAANRAVLANFKKGDAVEFDVPGTFTQPDGSKREGRLVRGTVTEVLSKEQGTLKVTEPSGAWANVPARNLRKQAAAPAQSEAPAAVDRKGVTESVTQPAAFAQNKLFTADKVEAARARLREKMNRINSGIDPEVLVDGMTIAGAYIESGVRKFADYAKAMRADFGPRITPYLLSFWEGARNYPGLDTKGMTSPDVSRTQYAKLLEAGLPVEEATAIGTEVARPKAKVNAPTGRTLRADWGVEHIDGWTTIEGGQNSPTDFGLKGGLKDAFLADATTYLRAVAATLRPLGFVPHVNAKGKDENPVSRNAAGPAVSGDVSLYLRNPDTGAQVYATVGATSMRGAVPTNAAGVSVMYRVSMKDGDKQAVAGVNRWAPTDLTAIDLADTIAWEAGRNKPELTRDAVAEPEPVGQGVDRRGVPPVQGGREPDAQPGDAPLYSGDVGTPQPDYVGEPAGPAVDGQDGLSESPPQTGVAPLSGDVASNVDQSTAPDTGIGPASILTFLPRNGAPGVAILEEDGFVTAVFRDDDGIARGAVRLAVSQAAKDMGDEVSTFVEPAFRRRKIATRLYDALAAAGYLIDVVSGTGDITPAGSALINARRAAQRSGASETPAPSSETAPDTPVQSRIEDFGERLEGARKDYALNWRERLTETVDEDIAAATLGTAWPEPDYQKLLDGGTDPYTVAAIHAMRDAIPTKPQKGWKLRGWVESVRDLRLYAASLIDGDMTATAFGERLTAPETSRVLQDLQGAIDLYLAAGHGRSLKGVSLRFHRYSLYRGEKNVELWAVEKKAKASSLSNWPQEIATSATKQGAIDLFLERLASGALDGEGARSIRFDIYSRNGNPRRFYVGKKIGSDHVDLQTFGSAQAARAYLSENYDALVEALDRYRDIPDERRATNEPRVGIDHRGGADVTPEQFAEAFNFRGVQFGNYVEGDRRQADLNAAYDALQDMAGVLGVPARAVSLNGALGLAFGARGKGGKNAASAHYEPGTVVINLTKSRGAGSLAHEWWHALDNYFSRVEGDAAGYMTERSEVGREVRPEVAAAFRNISEAIERTAIVTRSRVLDRRRTKEYWSTRREMSARAFESFIISRLADAGHANDYLANIVAPDAFAIPEGYPYPTVDEAPAVRAAFEELFHTVEARETPGGVALFSGATYDAMQGKAFGSAELLGAHLTDGPHGVAIKKLIDAGKIIVHKSAADLPETGGRDDVQAVTLGDGTIHLAADRLDGESALPVLLHEIFHSGVHPLLGDANWNALLNRVGAMYSVVAARGDDGSSKPSAFWKTALDRVETAQTPIANVAEEFGAYAIEERAKAPPGLRDVIDRLMGAFKAWVLRRFSRQLGAITPAQMQSLAVAALRSHPVATSDPSGRISYSRRGPTVEAIDAATPGILRTKLTDAMNGDFNALAMLPHDVLAGEYALDHNITAMKDYLRLKRQMDTARSKWHGKAAEVAKSWYVFQKLSGVKANQALMDLMHESTRAGVDPARPFTSILTPQDRDALAAGPDHAGYEDAVERAQSDRERQSDYGRLTETWRALPEKAKALYTSVRDTYREMSDAFEQALIDNLSKALDIRHRQVKDAYDTELIRIADSEMSKEAKQAAFDEAERVYNRESRIQRYAKGARMTRLRAFFETRNIAGPYFPLARFGNYFATARDKSSGDVLGFSRFETEGEQRKFIAEMKAAGYATEHGVLADGGGLRDQVDPQFVIDIETILEGADISDAIRDAVWQRWLETLPDMSLRKSRIHRKGTSGFSTDAMRAFANHMFHGSHQLARLQHALDMEDALDQAETQADRAKDANRAKLIVNEMRRRHAFTMNPTGAAWSQRVTSLAFIWFLAWRPSAALANLGQTVVMGVPILAAYDGKARSMARASFELTRALKDFAAGGGHAEQAKSLTSDEKRAMEAAYETGAIDRTQSHDLAGLSETGIKYRPGPAMLMEVISWSFHHTERLNREITFLAAYRMARRKGESHDQGVETAGDLTWKTHFNYTNTARPRFMQGDVAKAVFVFKNFQVNMIARLIRDTSQAFSGRSKAEKKQARIQLIGITGMMMLSAGITGTWGYGIVKAIAFAIAAMMGSDDNPEEEFKVGLRAMLGERLGNTEAGNLLGNMALEGVPGASLGISLSQRIGMPDLWFRSPDREMEMGATVEHYIMESVGASVSILGGWARGYDLAVNQGQVQRGIEAAVPNALKDPLRLYRYSKEGARSLKGDIVKDDFTTLELLYQGLGFMPATLARQYDDNSTAKNKESRITKRRQRIMVDFDKVVSAEGDMTDVEKRIDSFNNAHPGWAIMPRDLRRSVRSRARRHAEMRNGIYINPKLADEIYGGADDEEEE